MLGGLFMDDKKRALTLDKRSSYSIIFSEMINSARGGEEE